jgi:hypothetical protein
MRWTICLLSAVLTGLGLSPARAGDQPGDYLTKDGALKERREVLELQGGFAGCTGTSSALTPDGSWSTGPVLPPSEEKGEPQAKGKLTPEQLAKWAKELARHNLANLPSHGKPVVNPQVSKIRFGTKTVELQPEAGDSPPAEDKASRARYQGIAQAVKALCKEPKRE